MKARVFWFFILTAMLVAVVALWRRTPHPAVQPAITPSASQPVPPTQPKADVAIQDGKTIDFSRGAPVIKDDAKERAALESAVKEMQDATKDVTFGPRTPATDTNKKAEPPPAPPKS